MVCMLHYAHLYILDLLLPSRKDHFFLFFMIWWQISSEPKGRRVKQKSSNLTEREQMCTIRPLVVKYNWSLTFGEMDPCYRGMLRGTITPRAQRDGSLFKTGRDWELASVYDTSEGFGVIRRGVILVFFLCSTVFCPRHSFQLNDQIFGQHSSTDIWATQNPNCIKPNRSYEHREFNCWIWVQAILLTVWVATPMQSLKPKGQ